MANAKVSQLESISTLGDDDLLLVSSKSGSTYESKKITGSTLKNSVTPIIPECSFTEAKVKSAVQSALNDAGLKNLAQIISTMKQVSVKPAFLDTDNAYSVTKKGEGIYTHDENNVTYTATKDGMVFIHSTEVNTIVGVVKIYLDDIYIDTLGYNGLSSVSGAGSKSVMGSFRIAMKTGQTIKTVATTYAEVTLTYMPFL